MLSPFAVGNIIGHILFPREYALGGIPIDTIVSEGHSSEIQLTQNPVEFGMEVTDNVVIQPLSLIIEGVIIESNSNELLDWGLQGQAAKGANAVLSTFGFKNEFGTKVAGRWEMLLKLQRSGERIEFVSNLMSYSDMVIVSLSAKQDKESLDHLRFTALLQEVVIVDTQLFEGSLGELRARPDSRNDTAKGNGDTADRGAVKANSGTNSGKDVSDTSFLKKLKDSSTKSSAPDVIINVDSSALRILSI